MSTTKVKEKKAAGKHSHGIESQPVDQMALGRANFIAMAIAGAMIVLGFLLMLGSSATVENFDPDIFSVRRIVIGPLFAFLGFVAMAIAIIYNPRKKESKQ